MHPVEITKNVNLAKAFEFKAKAWLECENAWDEALFSYQESKKHWILALEQFLRLFEEKS